MIGRGHAGEVLRLAMWSGPRNLSTALMRSWGGRADTIVVDEPFYAHYLERTGIEHPGREDLGLLRGDGWTESASRQQAYYSTSRLIDCMSRI